VLFYPPDPGSESGIRDVAMVGSGSGISKQNLLKAFIQKEVGSGIRCFFTLGSGIRDGAIVGSGIRDKTFRIRNTDRDLTIFTPNMVIFKEAESKTQNTLKGQCHEMVI
jgi:hypothetical protein